MLVLHQAEEKQQTAQASCTAITWSSRARRRRVIHRDLKPENILMDDACNVKIADFGLAGITTPFSGSLSAACGTPEFTAPEIVRGEVRLLCLCHMSVFRSIISEPHSMCCL